MDTSNDLSQAILQPSSSSSTSSSFSSSSEGGFMDSLKNINATTWIIIILLLAFLGFNIFVYLAKGTQGVADFFAPLIKIVGGATASITGQAVNVSAEGAKAVVGGTADAVNSGLTGVQDLTPNNHNNGVNRNNGVTPNNAPSAIKGHQAVNTKQQVDNIQQSTLNKALNTSQSQQSPDQDYQANEASSSIGEQKAGWCFIGEEKGFRTCGQVTADDECMSGNIFPTQEICMNPSLRA
jgi:hypothetical protein